MTLLVFCFTWQTYPRLESYLGRLVGHHPGWCEALAEVTRLCHAVTWSPASSEMENINLTRIWRRYFCVHGLRQSWYWSTGPSWYTALHVMHLRPGLAEAALHEPAPGLSRPRDHFKINTNVHIQVPNLVAKFLSVSDKEDSNNMQQNKLPKGTKSR